MSNGDARQKWWTEHQEFMEHIFKHQARLWSIANSRVVGERLSAVEIWAEIMVLEFESFNEEKLNVKDER